MSQAGDRGRKGRRGPTLPIGAKPKQADEQWTMAHYHDIHYVLTVKRVRFMIVSGNLLTLVKIVV